MPGTGIAAAASVVSMDLSQTRALVVGASGGLGGAIARALREQGAPIVVTGRDPSRLAAIADDVGAPRIRLDLAEPTAADQAVGEAVALLGGLDLVVCCAGTVAFGPLSELDDAVLVRLFEANVFGPIRLARAAARVLGPGSALVMISGVVADHPAAGMAAYSASKAALTGFDRALAREFRRSGIRVLDARPPHLATGLADRPLAGIAPRLGPGRDPATAAAAILDALSSDAVEVEFPAA
jgi:NAD(P)-dependent dehydrogenase (short-subunit alcohol dehydrogenase family)